MKYATGKNCSTLTNTVLFPIVISRDYTHPFSTQQHRIVLKLLR